MSRFSLVLVVMIATLAIHSELNAQYRSPKLFQNMGRQLGIGWGAGYHSANPGPINNYYSPWNASNIPGVPQLPAPTFEPNRYDGSSYYLPQQTAPLPDLKVESNQQPAPLFQDSREVDRGNLFDQGSIHPLDQKPVPTQNQSHWQASSNRGTIKGLGPEVSNQKSLKNQIAEIRSRRR